MADNKPTTFNIYFIIYVIIAIAVVLGGANKLYGENLMISTFFFALLSALIFGIFGLRWFGTDKSLLSATPVSWPPVINTCPDYLTYYNLVVGAKSYDMCIDMLGVARNGSVTKFPVGNPPTDPLSSAYFPLATQSADPDQRRTELCRRTMTAGLTWEGVTNGESCISPDGTTSAPPTTTSGCPAV